MGHDCHGGSLAFANHVLRYGFRTMRGNTGGTKFEASVVLLSSVQTAATAAKEERILFTAGVNDTASTVIYKRKERNIRC